MPHGPGSTLCINPLPLLLLLHQKLKARRGRELVLSTYYVPKAALGPSCLVSFCPHHSPEVGLPPPRTDRKLRSRSQAGQGQAELGCGPGSPAPAVPLLALPPGQPCPTPASSAPCTEGGGGGGRELLAMGQLKALTPLPEIIQGLEATGLSRKQGQLRAQGWGGEDPGGGRHRPWAFLAELKGQVPRPVGALRAALAEPVSPAAPPPRLGLWYK